MYFQRGPAGRCWCCNHSSSGTTLSVTSDQGRKTDTDKIIGIPSTLSPATQVRGSRQPANLLICENIRRIAPCFTPLPHGCVFHPLAWPLPALCRWKLRPTPRHLHLK